MRHCLFKILIVLSVVFYVNEAAAQAKRSAFSVEIGKTGLLYNLTFDRLLKANVGFRLSAGSNFGDYLQATMAGGGIYYLAGKGKNFFEAGADVYYLDVYERSDDQRSLVLVYPDYTVKTFYATGNLGFRRYGVATLFRIGLSPGFIRSGFVPGGYVSFGLHF